MRKINIRVMSLILAMITVFVSTSFTAIAEDATVNQNESITDITEEVSFADPDEFIPAVYEVEDLREESVKHFSMPDGTYQAVSYSGAVHRKNADGSWRDIDNRLNAVTKNGFASYTTEDGRISFVQNTQSVDGGSMLYTLTEGNYMIAMGIMGTSSSGNIMADDNAVLVSAGEVTNHAPKPELLVTDSAEEQLSKLRDIDNTTEILYEDILNDTDIEYVLTGNDVKENIIVKAKRDNYTYTFQMLVKGLTATENADGSITLSDEVSGEAVYYIPAPYMYDANGEISYDVAYTLTEVFPEIYTLAVVADDTWIEAEGRAFPVVIDPTMEFEAVWSTYINSAYPNNNYSSTMTNYVGTSSTALYDFYLPNLPDGSEVTGSIIWMPYYYGVTSGNLIAGIYEILDFWDPDFVTYNTKPAISTSCLSTFNMVADPVITVSSPGTAYFDVTDAVETYYNEDGTLNPYYGFAIKRISGSNSSVILKNHECEFYPTIEIFYTYYVPDGVYALRNYGYVNYMSVNTPENPTPGKTLIQKGYSSGVTPIDTGSPDRASLFKISRRNNGNTYIIRSMLNNSLTISPSGTGFVTKEIPTNDNDVAYADTFCIEWGTWGFWIYPAGQPSKVIHISSASATALTSVSKDNATNGSKWQLKKYTGAKLEDIVLLNTNRTVAVGISYDYDAYMYSSTIGVNGPVVYSVADLDGSSTNIATVNVNSGVVLSSLHGQFNLNMVCSGYSALTKSIIIRSNRLPNPDAQNKTMWCWAACAKMVGVHNGGGSSLPAGAQIPNVLYTFSEEEIDVHSYEGNLFYGENHNSQITVDAGQRAIVRAICNTDANVGGGASHILQALTIVPDETVVTSYLEITDMSAIDSLNDFLESGVWVVAGTVLSNTNTGGHAIVIRGFNSVTNTYIYWDPWTDIEGSFSLNDLLHGTIDLEGSPDVRAITEIMFCQ